MQAAKPDRIQFAFSFIEVLFSLVILAFALLSLAKMELAALRYNRAAYFASQANAIASSALECLRVTHAHLTCKQEADRLITDFLPQGKLLLTLKQQDYRIVIGWYEPQHRYQHKICSSYFAKDYDCLSYTGKI